MRTKFWILWIGVIHLMTVNTLFGQEASISLSRDSILIGEQTELNISFAFPEKEKPIIEWGPIYDSISKKFDILSYGIIDTVVFKESGQKEITQKTLITSWDEGLHVINPVSFSYVSKQDTIKIESDAHLLTVGTIEIDKELPPKDIKPILSVPLTLKELLPWIIAVLLLLIAVWLIYKFRKKIFGKKEVHKIEKKPDIPAHIFALEKLEQLKEQNLWQEGRVKLYYIELSDILRKYIELRYYVNALEMTTDEILDSVKEYILYNSEQYSKLDEILKLSDLVKFAKYIPTPEDNQRSINQAFDFVYYTMKKEQNNTTDDSEVN